MEEDKISEEKSEESSEEVSADNKEDSPRETKTLLIAILVVIVFFIVFFLARNMLSPTGEVVTIDDLHNQNIEGDETVFNYLYNGYSFVFTNGLWNTQVQSPVDETLFDIPLHYGPKDLEDISVVGSLDIGFYKPNVYVAFDPLSEDMQYVALSAAELSLNLIKGLGVVPTAACAQNETEACEDRPIITCDGDEAVVYIKKAEDTLVSLEGDCVVIQGDGENIIRATDRFLYMQYNIMD